MKLRGLEVMIRSMTLLGFALAVAAPAVPRAATPAGARIRAGVERGGESREAATAPEPSLAGAPAPPSAGSRSAARVTVPEVPSGSGAVAAPGRLAPDWFASVYSGEGVEVRADERLFALYAVLNALGHDNAPRVREHPVPSRRMNGVRQRVRREVRLDPELAQRFERFFDAHPLPAVRYAQDVLELGLPPAFARLAGGSRELAGLEGLLAEAWGRHGLGELFLAVHAEYRQDLKGFQAAVDGPVQGLGSLLGPGVRSPAKLVVVVNLLDADAAAWSAEFGEELYIVAAPNDSADVVPTVAELARAEIARLSGRAGGASGRAEPLQELAIRGLAEGFALEALGRPPFGLHERLAAGCLPAEDVVRVIRDLREDRRANERKLAAAVSAVSRIARRTCRSTGGGEGTRQ